MTTTPEQVTHARFTGTWDIDQQVEPGSVPDRPAPRSRAGELYRPEWLRMSFRAGAENPSPYALRLENGSGFMRAARDSIRIYSITVSGSRLKENGEPGRRTVTEPFYTHLGQAPDWVQAAVRDAMAALGGPA